MYIVNTQLHTVIVFSVCGTLNLVYFGTFLCLRAVGGKEIAYYFIIKLRYFDLEDDEPLGIGYFFGPFY